MQRHLAVGFRWGCSLYCPMCSQAERMAFAGRTACGCAFAGTTTGLRFENHSTEVTNRAAKKL
jgi:hypothetical protein